MQAALNGQAKSLEILAFRLHGQEFCVKTTTIREIRGWVPATHLPHAPAEVVGVINLRGTVVPIVDLAVKLGMEAMVASERSAIVVAEVSGTVIGLLVDAVSDILTVASDNLQPVPQATIGGLDFSEGMIVTDSGMICFLNLQRLFGEGEFADCGIAA
ncbi:chemotaxis protein CheW [Oryzifoliimicrobium ureilyticus]|uniref:chemotaxis protein CheW n=1 Tax=Oryzifoliimicrobium ureilyticus TaxID=3113724 RepID=UPI00307669E1